MEIESKLLSFANTLEIAHLLEPSNVYKRQDELVAHCRSSKRPFLATMPVRHRFKCAECGIEMGEAELHLEDPSQPLESGSTFSYFQSPVGRFHYTELSKLHGVLVHGHPIPASLQALLAEVRA